MGRVHSLQNEYTQVCRIGTEIFYISAEYKNIRHKHTNDFVLGKVTKTLFVNFKAQRLLRAGGKIEKNEMGEACGAYGGGKRCAQGSGGET